MLVEYRRNVILCRVRSADLLSFALGIRHAGLHSGPDDGEFQFSEDRTHLNEGLAHRLDVPVPAINSDASEDFQTQMLGLDDVDDFAELLRRTAQT